MKKRVWLDHRWGRAGRHVGGRRWLRAAAATKPMAVQTAKVERQKIVQKVSATGKIQPKTKVDISADVSGKIERLRRRRGAMGREGRVPRRAGARAAMPPRSRAPWPTSAPPQANATLVHENLNRTKNEFERSKELLSSGSESKSAFEARQADYLVEVARYKVRAGSGLAGQGGAQAGARRPVEDHHLCTHGRDDQRPEQGAGRDRAGLRSSRRTSSS